MIIVVWCSVEFVNFEFLFEMVVVVGVIVGCYYSYGGKVFLGVVFNRCFLFFFVNFVLSFNRYFRRNVLFIGVLRVVVMVELVIVSEFYIKVF